MGLVSADAAALVPAAVAEAEALLVSSPPDLIIDALTPVLAMVAPAGLTQADREEWLGAAADALRGIPGDLLYRGIRVARASVDHPAKIVAAIMASAQAPWARRRGERAALGWLATTLRREQAAPVEVCTPDQAAEILRGQGLPVTPAPRAEPASRPEPTIDDYVALGLTREEAQGAVDERRRLLSRGRAKPIGSTDAVASAQAA
jgi:hypothetical protein